MKQNLRNIFDLFHEHVSMDWLIKITQKNFLFPFYHTISDTRLPHISNLYSIRSTKLFIQDIDFFCKYYNPVEIDDLYEIVSTQKKLSEPIFHLSFDDGLREFYTIVAPILEKKGVPATIFINTSFIDNKDIFFRYKISLIIEHINSTNAEHWYKELSNILGTSFNNKQILIQGLLQLTYNEQTIINNIANLLNINYSDYLQKVQPYLNSNEITDLLRRGFTIGSHSMDHPIFKELNFDEQKNQVIQSFNLLKIMFGLNKKYFSFPFSDDDIDTNFLNWLYNNEDCRLSFGISGLKDDFSKYHLHRVPIEGTLKTADKLIKSEYLYYLLKAIFNKNKIRRR